MSRPTQKNKGLSLEALCALTQGSLLTSPPFPELSIRGLNTLEEAQPHEISFLGNNRYIKDFTTSQAGAILVDKHFQAHKDNCALIQVDNPTLAFSAIIEHFMGEEEKPSYGVHPTAVIDPSVKLNAQNVSIGAHVTIESGATIKDFCIIAPGCFIGKNAHVGSHTTLHPHVVVAKNCRIGAHCILHAGVVIGADGYGYEWTGTQHTKIPQLGIVDIGAHVEIGANTTIDRARFGSTRIGEGTKIDNLVQIGHNVNIGKYCLIVAQTGIAGSATLEDGVVAAAKVGIAGHLTVGAGAILSAKTGVSASLRGGITYMGTPARPMQETLKVKALQKRLPKLLARIELLESQIQALEASRPS